MQTRFLCGLEKNEISEAVFLGFYNFASGTRFETRQRQDSSHHRCGPLHIALHYYHAFVCLKLKLDSSASFMEFC